MDWNFQAYRTELLSSTVPLCRCRHVVQVEVLRNFTLHLQIALSSDEAVFGGWDNVSKKYDVDYQTQEVHTEPLL